MKKLKYSNMVLNYFEIPLTVKCSLNCKHCANLIQYYTSALKNDPEPQEVLAQLESLLSKVDYVVTLRLLGGEPLLYKNITDVIDVCLSTEKIGTLAIVTNGTILPDDSFFQHIQGLPVRLDMSNYGALSTKKDLLIAKLKEYKIHYTIAEELKTWLDFGEPKLYQRTDEEYKSQFKNCKMPCRSYYKGKFHFCPRSNHGMDLGIIPDCPDDYIDLNREDMTPELFAELYAKLEAKDYIEACKYCKKGTGQLEEFPAAEQMPRLK